MVNMQCPQILEKFDYCVFALIQKESLWQKYQNFDRILLLNQLETVIFSLLFRQKITTIDDKTIILNFLLHFLIVIKYIFY